MAALGNLFCWLGFLSALILAGFGLFSSMPQRSKKIQRSIANSKKGVNVLIWMPLSASVLASIILFAAFLGRKFEFDYVYRYSSSDLPLFYTITSFWAGQEGSLLLWTFLLAVFATVFWYTARNRDYSLKSIGIIGLAEAFFFLVICIPASPFKLLPQQPVEGLGLNPLLQNLGMVFHPPTIFFAYALFTIPFAIVIGVLWTRSFDSNWLYDIRIWTLFAWLFMGIGNVLGALWAYVELGWGGFWAWDPVENASLLPWLTGTAALHSITIYEKRDTLKIWTYVLTFITFFLCILGTYLTRSGTVASVHAFQSSPIAGYFLVALIITLIFPLLLLVSRNSDIKPKDIGNYASREGTYAFANWFFSLFTLVVLWGTMFPLISSIFTGGAQAGANGGLSVSREFFDTWASPVMIAIAFLIAICPHFSFQKVNWKEFLKRLSAPFVMGVLLTVVTFGFWGKSWIGVLVSIIGFTGLFATLSLFYHDFKPLFKKTEGKWNKLKRMIVRQKRRYGGFLAHIGVLLMFIGVFSATIYRAETNLVLMPGGTGKYKDIEIVYNKQVFDKGPNFETYGTQILLREGGQVMGTLNPSMAYYPASNQQTYEVAIDWGLFRDVYLSLKEIQQNGRATITVTISYFTMFIWIGSLILFLGTMYAMWPRGRIKKE